MQEQSKTGHHVRNKYLSEHGVTNLNKIQMNQPWWQMHDLDKRLPLKDINNYDNINDGVKCNFWRLSDMETN